MANPNPIFVTGATGFIGTQLLETLTENNFSGFALVHVMPAKFQNEKISSKFVHVPGDLSFEFLASFIKANKPKTIFHLAGVTNPNHPDLVLVNVNYLDNLIRAVEMYSPETVIVLMSTAAVYGEGSDCKPFREEENSNPINVYGKCKLAAELLLKNYAARGGKTYVARAFNVIGKYQSENFFMSSLCKRIVDIEDNLIEGPLTIRDPDSIRDFLDVRDLANGLIQMITKSAPFGVYNFSSGLGISVRKTAEIALSLTSTKTTALDFTHSPENPNAIKKSVGDNSKACREFDWKLQYSLKDSISNILSHYRHN